MTYKYDETNWLGSQFPRVKTVKPLVSRMVMDMTKPSLDV